MALGASHAILLKQWLSPVTADETELDAETNRAKNQCREDLARLWFDDDTTWTTNWTDVEVLAALQQWFGDESSVFEMWMSGSLADFLVFLEPAITVWFRQEADATKETSLSNDAGFARDPIPGTQYYRMVGREYLYSDAPSGGEWLTIKARIAAQDQTGPHYVEADDNWQRTATDGVREYQNRETGLWERDHETERRLPYDVASNRWFYKGDWLPYDEASKAWFYNGEWQYVIGSKGEQVVSSELGEKDNQEVPLDVAINLLQSGLGISVDSMLADIDAMLGSLENSEGEK
ncbi:hypothetical protein [Streptacidiphilus rugosus]|uniref:hypothetical protein n=1 Tax=Streptacidiphilus rugosus TaxID=405783 RepID=UPI00056A8FA3|nr:hypothetical protein [Streptacidiphilus rugosus]